MALRKMLPMGPNSVPRVMLTIRYDKLAFVYEGYNEKGKYYRYLGRPDDTLKPDEIELLKKLIANKKGDDPPWTELVRITWCGDVADIPSRKKNKKFKRGFRFCGRFPYDPIEWVIYRRWVVLEAYHALGDAEKKNVQNCFIAHEASRGEDVEIRSQEDWHDYQRLDCWEKFQDEVLRSVTKEGFLRWRKQYFG